MAWYHFEQCLFEFYNNSGPVFKPLTNTYKFRLSFLIELLKFNILNIFEL